MRARSRPPAAAVRVTCRRLKDEVEIIVDDDGPGIRPDAIEKIFERFYTDRPHQGFGQNSGLGLSISKQIIEAHGGRIWAENRQGAATAPTSAPTGARRTLRRAAAGDVMARARLPTVHASAVLVGARAVLIRGPSGAGKSRLALALHSRPRKRGLLRVRPPGRRRPRPPRTASRPPAGAPGAGARRTDRSARARHPPAAITSRWRWSAWWSISRRRTPSGCRPASRDGRSRYRAAATCGRSRRGGLLPAARAAAVAARPTLNLRHDPCGQARRHRSNGSADTLPPIASALERCKGAPLPQCNITPKLPERPLRSGFGWS